MVQFIGDKIVEPKYAKVMDDRFTILSESEDHKALKRRAINLLKKAGAKTIVRESKIKGINGFVDVVGYWPSLTVAIECGKTSKERIATLQSHYDIVIHLPYCWTPKFQVQGITLLRKIRSEISIREGN